MTYTKFTWLSTSPISAYAMNHLESQYTEAKTIIDAHTHDDTIYTKTLSDEKFFSLDFMGEGSGFDADKLNGQHLSELLVSSMPKGVIMLWPSSDATVPAGWGICNGSTYGTIQSPDLRDRFVIGAGGSFVPGNTGGPGTFDGTITPLGSVTVGSHILTAAEIANHTHTFLEYDNILTTKWYYISGGIGTSDTHHQTRSSSIENQEVGGGGHTHTGSTITFSTIDPRPAYYAAYYIIKY